MHPGKRCCRGPVPRGLKRVQVQGAPGRVSCDRGQSPLDGVAVSEGFPEAVQNVGHVMTLAGAGLTYGSKLVTASLHRHNTSSAVRLVV